MTKKYMNYIIQGVEFNESENKKTKWLYDINHSTRELQGLDNSIKQLIQDINELKSVIKEALDNNYVVSIQIAEYIYDDEDNCKLVNIIYEECLNNENFNGWKFKEDKLIRNEGYNESV